MFHLRNCTVNVIYHPNGIKFYANVAAIFQNNIYNLPVTNCRNIAATLKCIIMPLQFCSYIEAILSWLCHFRLISINVILSHGIIAWILEQYCPIMLRQYCISETFQSCGNITNIVMYSYVNIDSTLCAV